MAQPGYLVGRNVSTMAVTPMTVSAVGGLSAGSAVDLHALQVFDELTYEGTLVTEEIHPLDAIVANYVPKYDDFTLTVGEIEQESGFCNLLSIWATTNYVRVQAQVTSFPNYAVGGGGTTGYILAGIGVRDTIRKGYVEGKNAVQLTLKPCGIAAFYGASGSTPPF